MKGPQALQQQIILCRGTSMLPLLENGDRLFDDPSTPFEAMEPGDIIRFDSPKNTSNVVHRIIAITEAGLITQGDNCEGPDKDLVQRKHNPIRLQRATRSGKEIPLPMGKAGMEWFRQCQRKKQRARSLRRWRRFASQTLILFLSRPILYRLDLLGKNLQVHSFPSGKIYLFFKGKKIGRLIEDEWHLFFPWKFLIDSKKIPHQPY